MKLTPRPKCTLATLLLVPFGTVYGAQSFQPFVETGIETTDNINSSVDDKQSDTAVNLGVGFTLSNLSESVEAKIVPRLGYHKSQDDSDRDSFNQDLTVFAKSFSDRSILGFKAKINNESIRRSEITDTGITTADKHRVLVNMSPSWQYRLSEVSDVQVTYNFTGVDYDNAEQFGLYDYNDQSAALTGTRNYSENLDVWLGTGYSRYKSFSRDSSAATSSGSLGFDYAISEKIKAGLSAGGQVTDSTIEGKKTTNTAAKSTGYLSYTDELVRVLTSYTKAVRPSGTGEVFDDNEVKFSVSGRAFDTFRWGLDVYYLKRTQLDNNSPETLTREYYSLQPRIDWKISLNSSLVLSYRHSMDKQTQFLGDIPKNEVFIDYVFKPQEKYL